MIDRCPLLGNTSSYTLNQQTLVVVGLKYFDQLVHKSAGAATRQIPGQCNLACILVFGTEVSIGCGSQQY